mmetsp:Transcript_127804/g.367948  ORF Transcript_127804/g.367948 Transcript_127804/m.367948 type:complete len:302 (+) Transcript_127804:381-1286(+)
MPGELRTLPGALGGESSPLEKLVPPVEASGDLGKEQVVLTRPAWGVRSTSVAAVEAPDIGDQAAAVGAAAGDAAVGDERADFGEWQVVTFVEAHCGGPHWKCRTWPVCVAKGRGGVAGNFSPSFSMSLGVFVSLGPFAIAPQSAWHSPSRLRLISSSASACRTFDSEIAVSVCRSSLSMAARRSWTMSVLPASSALGPPCACASPTNLCNALVTLWMRPLTELMRLSSLRSASIRRSCSSFPLDSIKARESSRRSILSVIASQPSIVRSSASSSVRWWPRRSSNCAARSWATLASILRCTL